MNTHARDRREPLIDIVMLVHDQAKWADLAIRAVEHHTAHPYRLIIVDMASVEQETKNVLDGARDRGHTLIVLPENRSFSHGVNIGVTNGRSPYICILNDDAIVTDGWDGWLINDASPKHVGLVGARSNYASGHQGNPSAVGPPPWLVFVCVAMRREVWDIVLPMDEITFDGFSSEDIDYSWRVLKAGFELKVSNAYVLHAGSRTLMAQNALGALGGESLQRNNEKYNARLLEKWGKDWCAEHNKGPPTILVVSYHAEEWTRVAFMGAFAGLKRPEGLAFSYYHQMRAPIAQARNLVADYALDKGYDWLVQIDDDATFPPSMIRQLIAHDKDIVCALAYQRKPPHTTCVFELDPTGGLHGRSLDGIEHTGLRKVDASGFHCSVMRTAVIKRLREGKKDAEGKVTVPGTRAYYGGFDNKLGEDFAFCHNVKRLGIAMYCDTELISGHIGASVVIDEAYKKRFLAGQGVL